jgi:catechol 2,3-dioxygenase-like lactoylglutathione lyase family enzyme
MFDHVALRVSDLEASRRFYGLALEPLGYHLLAEDAEAGYVGLGQDRPQFWLGRAASNGAGPAVAAGPLHIAFVSPDRISVDRFYGAAVAAGGRDNGAPGLRVHYHPGYYAAYVLDPDGNNVEAVCHLGP